MPRLNEISEIPAVAINLPPQFSSIILDGGELLFSLWKIQWI